MSGYTSTFRLSTDHVTDRILTFEPVVRPLNDLVGVIYCHSSNGTPHEVQYFGGLKDIIGTIATAGHSILSCDLGGPSLWGNSLNQTRLSEAYDLMHNTMNVLPGRVALIGLSMGGVTSLSWAANNNDKVSSVTGIIPAVNTTEIHTRNLGGLTERINSAFGGAYSENVFGVNHNPHTQAHSGKLSSTPISIFYGDSDVICTPTSQIEFAEASGAAITSLSGGHTDTTVSQIDPTSVLNFIRTSST